MINTQPNGKLSSFTNPAITTVQISIKMTRALIDNISIILQDETSQWDTCKRSKIQLSKQIVYYVPRRTMRVIARRATTLAGDGSRDKAEARSVLRALSRVS